jgi:hypothetical protein
MGIGVWREESGFIGCGGDGRWYCIGGPRGLPYSSMVLPTPN